MPATERKLPSIFIVIAIATLVLPIRDVVLKMYQWDWTGFGGGDSVSIRKDDQGNVIETVTTQEEGKTLWEWLELLGVPLTLATLGYLLQQQEQKRSRDDAKDEILAAYLDRLSALLVDKNLLAIAAKLHSQDKEQEDGQQIVGITPEQRELFYAAIDVIRARTLSILRRFQGDSDRKASVIQFLIEAEVLSKAKLNLTGADLSGAYLFRADLYETNLYRAELQGAYLTRASLQRANLQGADLRWGSFYAADLQGADLQGAFISEATLTKANLQGAELQGASLRKVNLDGANLYRADLYGANLYKAKLIGADLQGANLQGTELKHANLQGANLKGIQWSPETVWPDKDMVAKAINIPEKLKQELGIAPPEVPQGIKPETDSKD